MVAIKLSGKSLQPGSRAVLLSSAGPHSIITAEQASAVAKFRSAKKALVPFFNGENALFVQMLEPKSEDYRNYESARKAGAALAAELKNAGIETISLNTDGSDALLLAYTEGLALGSYCFDKYKSEKSEYRLKEILLEKSSIREEDLRRLNAVIDGVFLARDLVNEPGNCLNAEDFGEAVTRLGKECGFKTEVFNKAKIESLKMGGLLGVNAGSIDPPTFSILEYKPSGAVNSKPYVIIGKGVTFDTGGLSLKPTAGSMDSMKSDMAGGAAVIGLFCAAAKSGLPIHIVGLVPATDNRPGEMAIFPGDILNMYDGTTVEVLNTDAEGRLILADALAYAQKYDPELVIDLATLTGAASRAIGPYGIIYMSTAGKSVNDELEASGLDVYERLVELPLWDEYGELMKSDIADLKNIPGGGTAGAITAGKFLQHFTDFPWIHLDIAPVAFLDRADAYRPKNATGTGVRLLFDFLTKRTA
jgi:leucyl aminopeptidase